MIGSQAWSDTFLHSLEERQGNILTVKSFVEKPTQGEKLNRQLRLKQPREGRAAI